MGFDLGPIPLRLDSEPAQRLPAAPALFDETTCRPPFGPQARGEPCRL